MSLSSIKFMEDIYNKQVQYELVKAIEGGSISEALQTAIEIHSKRNNIMVGMHHRRDLKSASTDEWDDPRLADGVPIFARPKIADSKENHKLHTPFDKTIVNQKSSYMVGITPEPIIEDNDDQALELKKYLKGKGFEKGIQKLAKKASGAGAGFMLISSPKGSDDVYFTYPNEWGCFILYSQDTGEPLYGVRYWVDIDTRDTKQPENEESRKVGGEFYNNKSVWQISGTWGNIVLGEEVFHMMSDVPLIEFANNEERLGDVELTTSLQDAFDIADSDISSEISQMRLAYLALPNDEIDVDDDFMELLKKAGILLGDGKFVEKNLNSQAVENLKQDLEMRIYKYSNSYNPDELGQDKALTAFQIQQKLLRLESSSKETELMFKDALYRAIKIISDYKNLGINTDELMWSFTRNTPRNAMEDIKSSAEAGFRLSQKMMSRLLPYEIDQEQNELELQEEADAIFGEMVTGDDAVDGLPVDGAETVEEAVEVAKLSGIQITSANNIISSVAAGELTREAGINQLKVFLGLTDEQANRVMGRQ